MVRKERTGIWTVILLISFNLSPLLGQNAIILTNNVNHFSPDLANDYFADALEHFYSGNTDLAIEEYEKSIKYHPGHTASLLNLAYISSERGEYSMAVDYIGRSLSIDPENPIAHFNLGVIYQKMGRLDEAKTSYESALKYDELMAEAYSNLGRVYELQGQNGEAEGNYRKALEIKPDFHLALLNIGVILLIQEKYLESLSYLQKLTELDRSNNSAYYYAALNYYFLGDYLAAWHNVHLASELEFSPDNQFLRALSSKLPEPEISDDKANTSLSYNLSNKLN